MSGKSSVSDAIKQDTSLTIVHRNSNTHANNVSGNHALAPAEIDRQRQKKHMNKYVRYAITAPLNKEPKIGSPTL